MTNNGQLRNLQIRQVTFANLLMTVAMFGYRDLPKQIGTDQNRSERNGPKRTIENGGTESERSGPHAVGTETDRKELFSSYGNGLQWLPERHTDRAGHTFLPTYQTPKRRAWHGMARRGGAGWGGVGRSRAGQGRLVLSPYTYIGIGTG